MSLERGQNPGERKTEEEDSEEVQNLKKMIGLIVVEIQRLEKKKAEEDALSPAEEERLKRLTDTKGSYEGQLAELQK